MSARSSIRAGTCGVVAVAVLAMAQGKVIPRLSTWSPNVWAKGPREALSVYLTGEAIQRFVAERKNRDEGAEAVSLALRLNLS